MTVVGVKEKEKFVTRRKKNQNAWNKMRLNIFKHFKKKKKKQTNADCKCNMRRV